MVNLIPPTKKALKKKSPESLKEIYRVEILWRRRE